MKIRSKDFRVREGEKIKLKKWPTLVKPVYQSKEQYQKLLGEQVGTVPPENLAHGEIGIKIKRPRPFSSLISWYRGSESNRHGIAPTRF